MSARSSALPRPRAPTDRPAPVPPIRPQGSLGRGAHERILAAAGRLFAQRGINATAMNDLYLEARVSKRTLYQHFPGKDELVAAWLQAAAADVDSGPQAVLHRADLAPRAKLLELFTALAEQPRPLRGDPLVSAAVEFPDPAHPVHRAAAAHALALQAQLADLARAAGARDPEQVGRRLGLLYTGAAVGSVVADDPDVAAEAFGMAAAILRDAID
jgi:AcrR family transcriptional regulator